MRRYLLDTGIAGDFINKRRGVVDRAKAARDAGGLVGIGMPVLAELAYGVEKSETRDRNMRLLRKAVASLRLWPFGKDAAFEYGRLYAHLLAVGRPMQVQDVMIAAVAFTLGNCTVVSKDGDFLAVPGLAVENWAA